jgi:hypothetical protein
MAICMISYPFISSLFTNVLNLSASIEGRFYVCPKMGTEINSDMLGQVLEQINTPKKYPLCLMMPPRSAGEYGYKQASWQTYYITLFFLKQTYYGEGANISEYTKTATHTIEQDWHDMNRAATNFLQVLDRLQRINFFRDFRLTKGEKRIQPVTMIGVDRASGVRLDFSIDIEQECEIEDYNESDISLITVPSGDSHPEHQM